MLLFAVLFFSLISKSQLVPTSQWTGPVGLSPRRASAAVPNRFQLGLADEDFHGETETVGRITFLHTGQAAAQEQL